MNAFGDEAAQHPLLEDDGLAPVGGEFVIKRQLGCEITHRNDVAKRNVRA